MSRRGNGLDNAPMKSFFNTRKVELVHQRRWRPGTRRGETFSPPSRVTHNRSRIHSALGYRTPEQAERQMAS